MTALIGFKGILSSPFVKHKVTKRKIQRKYYLKRHFVKKTGFEFTKNDLGKFDHRPKSNPSDGLNASAAPKKMLGKVIFLENLHLIHLWRLKTRNTIQLKKPTQKP